jgi:uncharacterized membrane protein
MRLIRLLKRDLAREAREWVDEGLVEAQQAEAICARYGIDYRSREGHGYGVLVVLGYLFIGLALLTLIGANWEEIPRWLRTAGLVLLVLAANGLGLRSFLAGQTRPAVAWFFLGSLFYGTAIMLIAQIYHLGEHYPDGILWWALGVLPFAVLLGSGLLTGLMLVLAYTWFFVEAGLDFFPLLFPLFLAAAGYYLWQQGRSTLIFLLSVAGVVLYLEYALSWWLAERPGFAEAPENLVLGIGLLLLLQAAGQWLVTRPGPSAGDYGVLLQLWVLRVFLLLLLVLSFRSPWNELYRAAWAQPAFAVGIALACTALSLAILRAAGQALLPMLLSAAIYLGMLATLMLAPQEPASLALQVATNLLLIALGTWLIVRGILARQSHVFYTGVGSILATALLRYFDLVGDYVGAAILFAVFAVILLGVARFWKSREAGA